MSERDALEARILADPDDLEAWAIYADWLGSQGTPLGELASLQRQLAEAPSDRLRSQVEAVLAAHPKLAPQKVLRERQTYLAAEPEGQHRRWNLGSWAMTEVSLQWRCGHIVGARLAKADPEDGSVALLDLVQELLAHPQAKFLGRLVIGAYGERDEYDYTNVVAEIAKAPRPALRELQVAEFVQEQSELSWSALGNLTDVWKVAPNLRHVMVRGGHFTLGTLALPHAESFRVRTGGLARESFDAIVAADWPRLTSLEVWFGDSGYGGDCDVGQVRQLLAFERLPQLVDLGLQNAEFSDDIVDALIGAPETARLTRLDLSLGTLSNPAAVRLAEAGRARFPALRELDVHDNYLDAEAVARLTAAFPQAVVHADHQETPDHYGGETHYYVSVSE